MALANMKKHTGSTHNELGKTTVKFAKLVSVRFLILQNITRYTLKDANFVAKPLKQTET
jgi:hypothetical protein